MIASPPSFTSVNAASLAKVILPVPGPPPAGKPVKPHDPLQWSKPPDMTLKSGINYTASIATTDGVLGVQLLPGAAPNAVNNFKFLADQGFYKNVPIHRMIPGFMMQSGDPTGTGTGGPGYDLPDDKVPADLSYTKGVLAMANTGRPNTGGSQFFVMLGDVDLPKTYTIFGRVTSGLEALDKINARKVVDNGQGEQSKPADPIFVTDVKVTATPRTPK